MPKTEERRTIGTKPNEIKANPVRGQYYDALARRLLERYPDGSKLSNAEFSAFLQDEGVLETANKRNQRLGAWAEHIRHASTHPRMNTRSHYAYTFFWNHRDGWEVRRVSKKLSSGLSLRELEQACEAVRKRNRYENEGLDIGGLSEITQLRIQLGNQALAEACDDAVFAVRRVLKKLDELRVLPFEESLRELPPGDE